MICYIVLAAGKSTRMRSSTPKILFPLLGKPIIQYVLDAIAAPKDDIFIVSNRPYENYSCLRQSEPKGTAHAVFEALKSIPKKYDECIILCGDTPLITQETLQDVLESKSEITLTGFLIHDLSQPYGRIINDGEKIVEYKEASSKEKMSPYAYAGIMKIKRSLFEETFPKLQAHPEFYLTEVLSYTNASKEVIWKKEDEFIGVNTKEDLAQVERLLQKKLIKNLMLKGALFYHPDSSSVYHDTIIEPDAVIYPHVYIGPNVYIEKEAIIHPFTVLANCRIQTSAQIGPFAHIKHDTVIDEGAIIGNFVEIKKSTIGAKSKIKHLSYIGDTLMGQNVNIGAGTITCNYSGFEKNATQIQNHAFVGSNSTLLAPISIKEHAFVGAGSVLSKDVESYDLALTRCERKDIKNWVKKKEQQPR